MFRISLEQLMDMNKECWKIDNSITEERKIKWKRKIIEQKINFESFLIKNLSF